jgi:uronate dehydrogenase
MDRVLITGAAGRLGMVLRPGLRGRVRMLRLLDAAPLDASQPGEELINADVRDLGAC